MKSPHLLRILGAIGLATLISTGASAQGHAPAEEEEVAAEDLIGMVIVGNVSVPVVRGGRVRHYEYGTVGLAVEDTRKYMEDICERRFELADAFLVFLHSNPFTQGGATDGPEASKTLLSLTSQIVGPDIVTRVNVVWSRTPQSANNANAFGARTADVPCGAN
ncbi:MAG: hypothetical protein HOB82_09835 [Alphaproteobacteria bacterium]|nr:hypothetical protein [Alphaproteobacteria bacterium]MBT5861002.1 hypothetical protein [Alphaproteobacteria bacterium]